MPKKESAHQKTKGVVKKPRATRKQTNVEKRRWNGQEGGGPGRPKGSTLDKKWKLTPGQMSMARAIVEASVQGGLFPGSVAELSRAIGFKKEYVRKMLLREDFHAYINHLLISEGIMLEVSFWRGMAIGMQAGDPRVLQLYAQMTGKIQKKEAPKLRVEIVSPEGERTALPVYEDIEDAEVIEEDD